MSNGNEHVGWYTFINVNWYNILERYASFMLITKISGEYCYFKLQTTQKLSRFVVSVLSRHNNDLCLYTGSNKLSLMVESLVHFITTSWRTCLIGLGK